MSLCIDDRPTTDARSCARLRPSVAAARLPHHILAHLFQYVTLKDVTSCMRVCRHWFAYLEYEDCEVWELFSRRNMSDVSLNEQTLLSEVATYKAKLRAFAHAWNPRDASRNIYIRPNGFTMHRNPIAQSTDGVRGKIGVTTGLHAWEVTWDGPLGTVAVVGLATKHAAMQCPGYMALLGSDDQSWGWNLVDNTLLHDGEVVRQYPQFNNPVKYQVGERIRMILDCDDHILYFEKGCEFLGIAFTHLPPLKLFPAICAVYGNTEVSMIYLGGPLLG